MTPADELRAHVRTELAKAKLSQAAACRQLGCSTKHMSMMLTGQAPITLDWADRILALCGKRIVIKVQRRPKEQP